MEHAENNRYKSQNFNLAMPLYCGVDNWLSGN
jgi:hypothetical protein